MKECYNLPAVNITATGRTLFVEMGHSDKENQ